MKIHIFFDYYWLHRETHAVFEQLVKHLEQLSAFLANRNFTRKYRRADWSVFDLPGEADTVNNNTITEDEEPLPLYAEARSKRLRLVSDLRLLEVDNTTDVDPRFH
jgi:hypothetical protein